MEDNNLTAASREWSERPADQRFETLEALHNAVTGFHNAARTSEQVAVKSLTVQPYGVNDLVLVGGKGIPAYFTHWSFGQLCQRVGAPASYLRLLPNQLAKSCINHGIAHADDDQKVNMLLHSNGRWTIRALTGTGYDRIWNSDITKRLFDLKKYGWVVPPARPAFAGQPGTRKATKADADRIKQDGFGGAIKVGDDIAPAGLYASDRDMFCFFVNPSRVITAGGSNLFRGTFISNSEVGDKAFRVTNFLFNNVCGNHIVWGASDVYTLNIRHVGQANDKAWKGIEAELIRYNDLSSGEETRKISAAAKFMLGETKDEVLDMLFARNILSRRQLSEAYVEAEVHVGTDAKGVDPKSAWGYVQGLTRLSQKSEYADERVAIDSAAGKVMEMAF